MSFEITDTLRVTIVGRPEPLSLTLRATVTDIPVIELRVDGVVIADGDLITMPAFIAGASSSSTLHVTNLGEGALVLTSALTTGAGLSVNVSSLPVTLTTGQSHDLVMTATSASAGTVVGTVTLAGEHAASLMANVQALVNPACTNALSNTWASKVTAAGGTYSDADLLLMCQLATQIQTKAWASKVQLLMPFVGGNLAAACIPLINTLPNTIGGPAGSFVATPVNMVNADFVANIGVIGGATKYIRMGGASLNDATGAMDSIFKFSTGGVDGYTWGFWNKTASYPVSQPPFGLQNTTTFGLNCYNSFGTVLTASRFGAFGSPSPPSWQQLFVDVAQAPGIRLIHTAMKSGGGSSTNRIFADGVLIGTNTFAGNIGHELDLPAALLGITNTNTPGAPVVQSAPNSSCGCFYAVQHTITDAEVLELYQLLRDYLMTPMGRL